MKVLFRHADCLSRDSQCACADAHVYYSVLFIFVNLFKGHGTRQFVVCVRVYVSSEMK